MSSESKTEAIEYLLKFEFGELRPTNSKRLLAKRAEYLAMPTKQVDTLANEVRCMRQFHSARADFNHWAKLATWTLEESITLCFGREPRVVTRRDMQSRVKSLPLAKQYMDAHEIVRRAFEAYELEASNAPDVFITWAEHVGLPFPAELKAKVAEQRPVTDWRSLYEQEHDSLSEARARIAELERELEKPLDARERATLLCIIGALAKEQGLDLSQPMKAGEAVKVMLPDVQLSARTIGEHLKAVCEAMDSRKV